MNVLFVSTGYPPGTGGIASYVWNLAHLLRADGHEVHVLSCERGAIARDDDDDGVIVHRRPQVRLRGLARVTGNDELALRIRLAASVRRHLHRIGFDPDVIEYADWGAEGLFLPRKGPRRVAQIHGPHHLVLTYNGDAVRRSDRLVIALERRATRRADVVVVPSEHLAAELHEWLGGAAVVVSPHPVAASPVPATDVIHTGPRVLCVSRLQPLKGVDCLVDAVAILTRRRPDIELRVVAASGTSAQGRRDLEERARSAGITVSITGPLSRAELGHEYEAARVVAVPSRFETFSMVALEAMARHRPVVVTENTGVAPFVRAGDAGSVVPIDDPDRLADALAIYLDDPAVASASGERAARVVEQHLSGRLALERRLAIYRGDTARSRA